LPLSKVARRRCCASLARAEKQAAAKEQPPFHRCATPKSAYKPSTTLHAPPTYTGRDEFFARLHSPPSSVAPLYTSNPLRSSKLARNNGQNQLRQVLLPRSGFDLSLAKFFCLEVVLSLRVSSCFAPTMVLKPSLGRRNASTWF
jgi:hypothetical protein